MSKNTIGEESLIPKFIYLKIRRRDGVESLTTLEEGEFKVPIDGCINNTMFWSMKFEYLHFRLWFILPLPGQATSLCW